MSEQRRRRRRVPDGYVSGPAAATEATARALARLDEAGPDGAPATLILVEGVSDQIAIETLARALGRPLDSVDAAVVPTGGAHAIGKFVERLGGGRPGPRLLAMCDLREEPYVRRSIERWPGDVELFVCDADLEDELIRSLTPEVVLMVLDATGQLGSFRTLQRQPVWRDQPVDQQLRRFFSSGATRKSRYAEELVLAAVAAGRVPAPLQQLLARVLAAD